MSLNISCLHVIYGDSGWVVSDVAGKKKACLPGRVLPLDLRLHLTDIEVKGLEAKDLEVIQGRS